MHSLDYRNDPKLTELQLRIDQIETEKRAADAAVNAGRVELAAAQAHLEEAQIRALIDSSGTKTVADLTKRVEAAEKQLAQAQAAAARYPKAWERLRAIADQKKLAAAQAARTNLLREYERAVAMLASALDAAAEANKRVEELATLAWQQFGLPIAGARVKASVHDLSWSELSPDKHSRLADWLREVAEHHPAALAENHPARVHVRHTREVQKRNDAAQEANRRRDYESLRPPHPRYFGGSQ